MHKSAISNPYFMESAPKERTPIVFLEGKDRAHCYGCGREVLPKIIDTQFLSRPLAVCPYCQSVVQDPPSAAAPKKETKPATQLEPVLTGTERAVYDLLCARPNQVVTYADFSGIGISMTSGNFGIANYIKTIRRILPHLQVENVRGVGYMLVQDEGQS